jgi:hypothetical protein
VSNYPCKLIEDLIPLYIENDVSDATKVIIEKHLKECKNCTFLVQEYSNDELKLEDFKEDLPQANTYKKWMKKLKTWGLLSAIVLILVAISIGVISYRIGEIPKNDLLTLKSIVRTLEKQGVILKEDSSKSPDAFELSGVKPTVYSVDKEKGTLLIYTFKSIEERKDIINNSDKHNNQFSLFEVPLEARNAYLIYIASVPENPTTEEWNIIAKPIHLISDIVFKYLNDGKEVIYEGESENWKGIFTLKYYEHWWHDETGTLKVEYYSEQYAEIQYKTSDIEDIGTIDFEYKTTSGSGRTTGDILDKDGHLKLGGDGGGGNGSMPSLDEDIDFTIKWNGMEENIILKPQ